MTLHTLVAYLALTDASLAGVVGAVEAQPRPPQMQPQLPPFVPDLQGEHPHPVGRCGFLRLLALPCRWSRLQVSSMQPPDSPASFPESSSSSPFSPLRSSESFWCFSSCSSPSILACSKIDFVLLLTYLRTCAMHNW